MSQVVFYAPGIIPSAPAHNMAEQWDDSTSTYTSWDQAGAVTLTRPYTAEETAAAQASAAARTAAATVDTAKGNLSGLLAQQSAFGTQLQTDISTVTSTGWAALSAADQQAIMLRVLDGFGTVMTAIANHLTVTGIT